MIFGIVIALVLAAIGFFHWLQGFFSSTLSAICAVVAAMVALSYQETLLEGPLANMSPNWMPALTILGLFGLTYVILRTIIDKLVPGGIMLPSLADKIGGAAMGLVAGSFGLGIVVIAGQLMPFGPSIGGYTRFESRPQRGVTVPGGGTNRAAKDAALYDEMTSDQFEDEKRSKLLAPVDDLVVGTIAHVSKGALGAGKPFESVHPDYLTELYGQRLGIQSAAARSIVNVPAKGQTAVEVVGVYNAPNFTPAQIVDQEFKRYRDTPLKISATGSDRRVVVRVRFNTTPELDKLLRMSPAAVRIVASRPSQTTEGMDPKNHFPIGTLDATGLLYTSRIDDFLVVEVPAKKLDGSGEGPAEVDFVFQVSEKGFFADGDGKAPDAKIADGTFLEVKRFGRVDLSGTAIKASMPRLNSLGIVRKHLEYDGGPAPLVAGKAGTSASPNKPVGQGGGGGVLGQRLAGTWENRGLPGSATTTYTFTADGNLTMVVGSNSTPMRWLASGPPQGETLTIKVAPVGTDPANGNTITLQFVDNDTFNATDSTGGGKRFVRSGSAASSEAPPAQQSIAPDELIPKMSGTWENASGLSYLFRPDLTYTANQAARPGVEAKSANGTWKILSNEGPTILNIQLVKTPDGQPNNQKWDVAESASGQITRLDTKPTATIFKRKS